MKLEKQLLYLIAAASMMALTPRSILAGDVTGDRANIGQGHVLTGNQATITGGIGNTNKSDACVIAGGSSNMIETNANEYCTIVGGLQNIIFAGSYRSTIAGGAFNQIGDDAHRCTIGGGDQNLIREDAYAGWIGGGLQNVIDKTSSYCSVGGGGGNWIKTNAPYATISGGWSNIIGNMYTADVSGSTLAGGWRNIIDDQSAFATLSGGRSSYIETNSPFATIAGGVDNRIKVSSSHSVIAGGYANTNQSTASTVGGGENNSALGYASTVPGGAYDKASGSGSFAAGYRAKANHDGTFVWGDYTGADVASTAANQFVVRASGGVWLGTNSSVAIGAGRFLDTSSGGNLTHGGTWANNSDRNSKENFKPVDSKQVLDKLASMPVTTWNYKVEGKQIEHIGPVAQDFQATFKYGGDDKSISTSDASGVAFAAIQGLYEMLREKDTQLKELQKELKAVKEQLAK